MTRWDAIRGARVMAVLASMLVVGPAFSQPSFAGVWSMTLTEDFPDRLPGPELGDYAGLPLNDSDRARARSWNATILSLPDYQCRVHPADYANSFADIRMWHEIDTTTQDLIAILVDEHVVVPVRLRAVLVRVVTDADQERRIARVLIVGDVRFAARSLSKVADDGEEELARVTGGRKRPEVIHAEDFDPVRE